MEPSPSAALADAFATEWGAVVATLIRVTGDWALAEDSAAEAFATAARRWPVDGVPRRPRALLRLVREDFRAPQLGLHDPARAVAGVCVPQQRPGRCLGLRRDPRVLPRGL